MWYFGAAGVFSGLYARGCMCVCIIVGSMAAAVWRDFSDLLNISRFVLKIAGFIPYIIVLNTNFVP